MHAPALLLWRNVSVTAEYSPRSAINCKRNPWTVIPLSAWGPLTFLRGVLSWKLLPLPIFFVIVPCYLKHMVVEDSSILNPIRSAPPCHARHPVSRRTLSTEGFLRTWALSLRSQIQLSHVLCCTMNSAFLTLHIQQAINLADSGPAPLPSPPLSLYPISRGGRISSSCHLLPSRPPQFNIPVWSSPLQLSCSKVSFPHWCSPVLQSICLALSPLLATSLLRRLTFPKPF